MAHRYFEGKAHALLYSKYRPVPPKKLIERIVNFIQEKYTGKLSAAVDVGCGSGQSTGFFSPYFQNVIGTDISLAQIEKARECNTFQNVSFEVSPAEIIPFLKESVQLVSASQAAHWFDLPKFYDEGLRVLSPGGVMALYGYSFPRFRISDNFVINAKLDEALDEFYAKDLDGYWAAERKLVDSRYVDFIIPYNDFMRDDSFYHDMETNVSDIINYCYTWSGYQNFCKKNGEEKGELLIQKLKDRFMKIAGGSTSNSPEETIFTKRTSFYLLMARK